MALQVLTALVLSATGTAAQLTPLVDTFIGTGGRGYGVGGSPPGAQVPFGALRLSPDSSLGPLWVFFDEFGGYHFEDTEIRAFSHTHMVGSGVGDLGNFGMITTRWFNSSVYTDSATFAHYRSRFAKATEAALPGYYTAYLEDAETLAEVVAVSTHSGMHRYTCYPRGAPAAQPCILLLDACHTTSEESSHACAWANVSVTPDSTNPGGAIITSSIHNKGRMTGGGRNHGVDIHFVANVTARAVNASQQQQQQQQQGLAHNATLWANNTQLGASVTSAESASGNIGLILEFENTGAAAVEVMVRVGLSFVDQAHAVQNLLAAQTTSQGTDWLEFNAAVDAAESVWESLLSRVVVAGAEDAGAAIASRGAGLPPAARALAYKAARNSSLVDPLQIVMASTVYRAFKAPTNYSEHDGSYMGLDATVHTTAPGAAFLSDLSEWDISRTQVPWLTLTAPEVSADLAMSLVAMAVQNNGLPRWPIASTDAYCMPGAHGVVIMTDAVVKGVAGVNATAVLSTVLSSLAAEEALENFTVYGYIPVGSSYTSASDTLEWAWDAGIGSGLATFLGDSANAARLWNLSQAYRRVWDPKDPRHIFCPKTIAGVFECPFDAALPYFLTLGGYTEGNALQYAAFVPHDMPSLVNELYPSRFVFAETLEAFHNNSIGWAWNTSLPNPYWWPGNEPDLLAPWSFAFAGNEYATRTQHWVRWTLQTYYTAEARGMPGNDDYGEMSAWAAFGLLGFYPLSGTQTYILGVPSFPNATLSAPAGLQLSIVAHNFSATNIWAYRAAVNGLALPTPFVNHSQLVCGSRTGPVSGEGGMCSLGESALLEFWLTDREQPWGTSSG